MAHRENNPLVSAETVRPSSTYIILYIQIDTLNKSQTLSSEKGTHDGPPLLTRFNIDMDK